MREDELHSWLDAYGRAWESNDSDGFVALFSDGASYAENPYDDPVVGSDAIREYFGLMAQHQKDVSFGFEIHSVSPVVAHWWASYSKVTNGEPTRLDGVFLLDFDDDGRCASLREWWHADPSPAF
ncbi:MAG: nuclear transport factor 2 family protein [Acidimicrobiia bacterium]